MKKVSMLTVLMTTMLWGYSIVFAQDCPACDMPPEHIQIYEGVMTELIGYIATAPEDAGANSGVINVATTFALDSALTSLAIARILPVHTAGDIFGGMQMLAGSQTFVRDREIMLRIDRSIAMRTLSMIQGSRNSDPIPVAVLEQIDGSLQKLGYLKLRLAESEYAKYKMQEKGKNGATYGDYASLLRQLNWFYKQMYLNKRYNPLLKDLGVGYWKTDKEDDNAGAKTFGPEDAGTFITSVNVVVDQTFAPLYGFFKGPNHEWLDINDVKDNGYYVDLYETIWNVEKQYRCSLGLKSDCSERKEIREESLELAQERIIKDGNRAIKTFKDAWGRLKGALGGGSSENQKAAEQRKQALLYSQRGEAAGDEKRRLLNVDTHIEPAPHSVSSLWKGITDVWRKKSDRLGQDEQYYPNSSTPSNQPINNSFKDAQLYKDPVTLLQEQVKVLESNPKSRFTQEGIGLTNTKGQIILEQQTERIQQSFISVLALQEGIQQEDIFTDVKRTTHRFPLLSAAVYKNIDIIGTKNDSGKLFNAMGNVCEQQCSNLDPTCWPIAQ